MSEINALKELINEFDFITDDVNVADVINNAIAYIDKLEAENKGLMEIISIQRNNLAVYRYKLDKLKK